MSTDKSPASASKITEQRAPEQQEQEVSEQPVPLPLLARRAKTNPATLTRQHILQLQRIIGNRAVSHLLSRKTVVSTGVADIQRTDLTGTKRKETDTDTNSGSDTTREPQVKKQDTRDGTTDELRGSGGETESTGEQIVATTSDDDGASDTDGNSTGQPVDINGGDTNGGQNGSTSDQSGDTSSTESEGGLEPMDAETAKPPSISASDPIPSLMSDPDSGLQIYWTRGGVGTTNTEDKYGKDSIDLKEVSISTKRRVTAQETKQGDHLVAWSAMVQYWGNQLSNKSLTAALDTLEAWIQEDQAYEDQKTKGEKYYDTDRNNRLAAITLIRNLRDKHGTPGKVMRKFEIALSLFVRTNQHASFATIGDASGGHGEADAMGKLKDKNKTVTANADGEAAKECNELALSLLDIGKVGNDDQKAKAISSWCDMLSSLFPTLFDLAYLTFLADTDPRLVAGDTVKNWKSKWGVIRKNKSFEDTESADPTMIKTLLSQQSLVRAEIAPRNKSGNEVVYPATAIWLNQLEIPDLRANTRFAPAQGAHTIAWTFKRNSLMTMFNNISISDAVGRLEKLIAFDLDDFDQFQGKSKKITNVKAEYEQLRTDILKLKDGNFTMASWKRAVNNAFGRYVQCNQLLMTTTYGGASTPTGHAEGEANRVFYTPLGEKIPAPQGAESTRISNIPAKIAVLPAYLDLGILYQQLVYQAQDYADYKKNTGSTRKLNPPSDFNATPEDKQRDLESARRKQEDNEKKRAEAANKERANNATLFKEAIQAAGIESGPPYDAKVVYNYLIKQTKFGAPLKNQVASAIDVNQFNELVNMLKETARLFDQEKDDLYALATNSRIETEPVENEAESTTASASIVQIEDPDANEAILKYVTETLKELVAPINTGDIKKQLKQKANSKKDQYKGVASHLDHFREQDPQVKAETEKRGQKAEAIFKLAGGTRESDGSLDKMDVEQKLSTDAERIFEQSLPLAKKILGDFWSHLQYLDPKVFAEFEKDTIKQQDFLKAVFTAPLADADNKVVDKKKKSTDRMVAEPLQIHLGKELYQQFMGKFRTYVETTVSGKVTELLPSEKMETVTTDEAVVSGETVMEH